LNTGLDPSDFETPEAIEAGRKLFAGECAFYWAANRASNLPPPERPEAAFVGRSNVGKSSLINALTGRRTLARTSQTPGRTRELNFFNLGGRLTLVDMPGYGYAKAPKTQIAGWTALARTYLQQRTVLARLFLLIDGRHGTKDADHDLMGLMDRSAVSFQVVLTKCDKLSKAELDRMRATTLDECSRYTTCYPAAVATSAQSGDGIPLLRSFLAGLALPRPISTEE